jgi:hypothetical protein
MKAFHLLLEHVSKSQIARMQRIASSFVHAFIRDSMHVIVGSGE